MRGSDKSFKKACAAIENCTQVPDLVFDVITCVNQKNIHELEDVRDLLIESGVKEWRLIIVFPKGRAKGLELFKLSKEQYRRLVNFIKDCRTSGTIKASVGCDGFFGDDEGKVRDGCFFCRAGINVGSVLIDGSISACPGLRDDYIQGNIYKDDFYEVWENKFQIMRKRKWTKTGECENCKVYRYCKGGGLHLRDEKTGELLICNYNLL
jgi:radical SAM protein with 4Fe4S-binding SPASM domain